MRRHLLTAALLLLPGLSLAQISPQEVAEASYPGGRLPEGQSALTAKVQLLLDRADISPGVIDGYRGGMTTSAIAAFETREGLPVDGEMDSTVWQALGGPTAQSILRRHVVTQEDLAQVTGPNPDDYGQMARQELLGYASAAEALAEQFHLDQDFFEMLNPGGSYRPGTEITVLSVRDPAQAEVTSITIDKSSQRLIARTATGETVANYPVAIGSAQTPSPSGTHEVLAVAVDPTYSYRPDENFQQGSNDEPLTIPPGPNGPVGTVWIDLSKPTYGIHGTPDPAELFVAQSHGCVRMTNWDVEELAAMVSQGVTVEFRP